MRQKPVRILLVLALLAGAVAALQGQTTHSSAAGTLDDWPMFQHDVARTAFNDAEVRLSPSNAANLKLKWQYKIEGVIAAQPIVVGDSVYIGAWDGFLYSLDRETGHLRWKLNLGTTTGPPDCTPPNAGITSAPAVVDGVIYIGGGDQYKYAIDARTGTPIWRFESGDNSAEVGAYNWDSPAVFNGKVYTGISSFCDHPFVQGKLWALDTKTGQPQQQVNFVRDGQLGGGIWTSPAVDPATGAVYVTTGSGDEVIDYAYAIAVLDPQTLRVLSAWQIPDGEQVTDGDWGSTPTVFKDKNGRTLVGAGAKNGFYYAFDSNRIGDGPVWKYKVAKGGECPLCGEGTIASSAFAYNTLFTAGGNTTVNGTAVGGAVRAHDPATGAVLWERPTAGAIFGSLVVANNLVIAAADQEVVVLDARNGQRLWSVDTGQRMFGAPSVAGGVIYAGDTTGNLYAFTAGPYADPQPQPAQTPGSTPATTASQPITAPPLPGASRCFDQTGKCIRGEFLDYWSANGGLERYGFPVTDELLEGGRTVQYTQRARFEQHKENAPPYNVLLGRLAVELTKGREQEEPFRRTEQKQGQTYISATGHNVSGPILQYWQANGGVPVFGYPISEAFQEKSLTDGKTYLVQYFERQRLEYHPESTDPRFQVLIGLLGAESYSSTYASQR